jgi:hypothetical protein
MQMKYIVASLLGLAIHSVALGQTVLFDFETDNQGWGSFGAITTDSGQLPFDGSSGQGRYHSANFSEPDEGNFGIVDVSPTGLNLSPYGGLSVDARFIDVLDFPPFEGVKELDIVVAKGTGASEEEFFAPKVTMTDTYQTFSVLFSVFRSALTTLPPSPADLSAMQIKFVILNTNGTGTAQFQYDQVTGLPPVAADNADFNGNGKVDGRDFLIWQRGFGTGNSLATGDANDSGTVDGADLIVWQTQYGMGALSALTTSAVPEPSTAFMLPLMLSVILGLRRASHA